MTYAFSLDHHDTADLWRYSSSRNEPTGHIPAGMDLRALSLADSFPQNRTNNSFQERAAGRPLAPFNWAGLPESLKRKVFSLAEDASANRLALANHETLAVALRVPQLALNQARLMSVLKGKTEQGLLAALTEHQDALRFRTRPLALPISTSQEVLLKISDLLQGSSQRPLLVFPREWPNMLVVIPDVFDFRIENIGERFGRLIREKDKAEGGDKLLLQSLIQATMIDMQSRRQF